MYEDTHYVFVMLGDAKILQIAYCGVLMASHKRMRGEGQQKYRVFSNLIRTLFTVSEDKNIRCRLESRAD